MSASFDLSEIRPSLAAASGRLASTVPQEWLHQFSRTHTVVVSGFLLGLSAWWTMSGGHSASGIGAAVLLSGGALIGVPHGATDFLTAYRVFGKAPGWLWLPAFVLIYLALFFAVLSAWRGFPTVTLLSFLLVSTLHFAREDMAAYGLASSRIRWLARASTPLLPIVVLHLPEVAPFFAAMSGQEGRGVEVALQPFQVPLLGGWLAILATTLLQNLNGSDRRAERRMESFELVALATAAVVLPPLVTFAVYFCVVHAVRHMAGLTAGLHPYDGRRAWIMSAVVIVPVAMILVALLAGFWSEVWGAMATDTLLCTALQLVAALAVPHMILEAMSRNTDTPVLKTVSTFANVNIGAGHNR